MGAGAKKQRYDELAEDELANAALDEIEYALSEPDDEPPTAAAGALGSSAAPQEDQPWYSRLADRVRGAGETAHDAYIGATHGATMGLADDAAGVVSPETAAAWRSNDAAAQQRSPTAFAAGDMAGSLLMPVGRVVKGAGALANAANTAVNAGVQAFGRGFGDSDPEAPALARVAAAAKQGSVGAATGGAVSGGLGALGKGATAAAGLLDDKAAQARAAAVGATGADLRKLADRRGLDYATGNVGRMPEELGVTNRFWPVSTAGYEKRLGARANAANQQIDRSVADAEAQGVSDVTRAQSRGNIMGELAQKRDDALRGPLGNREAQASALDNVRTGIGNQPLNTPTQLRAVKTQMDRATYPDAVSGSPESNLGLAHAAGGHAIRGELRDVMSYALPETNRAFTQGNQDYARAEMLRELAEKRAATQYAGGGIAGNLGAGAVGAGVGFTMAGTAGLLPGAALGMARPAAAAAQQYGPDLGANLARLGSDAAASSGRLATATAGADGLGALVGYAQSEDPADEYERLRREGGMP